jgi:hypothetical protein
VEAGLQQQALMLYRKTSLNFFSENLMRFLQWGKNEE